MKTPETTAAEFLQKLNELLGEYKAEITYTNADDGLHISIDGKEIFTGWLPSNL